MSYEDMARPHLVQVLGDDEGDVPMPCGTAMVDASVVGQGRLVRVGDLADHLIPLLAAVHGGAVTLPEVADVPSEVGS